jgi:hypothetical protein
LQDALGLVFEELLALQELQTWGFVDAGLLRDIAARQARFLASSGW